MQQAALKLLYRGEDLAGIKNLTAYVYSVLENAAKDHFKKRKKETLTSEDSGGREEGTEGTVLAREMKGVIMAALDRLDEKQRYVFVETELKGRSYDELARETGERLGTLLSRKSRAAKKLKETIREYMYQEER